MTPAARPAENPSEPGILCSIRRRIEALGLDLGGMTVITEAATGAYACTAPIAAMAGAAVHAVARDTRRYGSFEDAVQATLGLAEEAGVAHRITVSRSIDPHVLKSCNIITNSGHLRPISARMIAQLPERAVLALMFEAWEFRAPDFDLAACRDRGIRVAAVNERHPDVGVFPFLGPLCVRLLKDAGLPVPGLRVALLCDNPFAPFIGQGLRTAGALVSTFPDAGSVPPGDWQAVVVALEPFRNPPLGAVELRTLAARAPRASLVQFWGDIDRASAPGGWPTLIWPPNAPLPGHMAVLLSALGHEPVVRLQAGGLRAAEIVARGLPMTEGGVAELL